LVRPEDFEATMTTPHLGRAEAARSALLPAEDLQLQILLAWWARS
jgi:hypothetical protein